MDGEGAVRGFGIEIATEERRPLVHSDQAVPAVVGDRIAGEHGVGDRQLERRAVKASRPRACRFPWRAALVSASCRIR